METGVEQERGRQTISDRLAIPFFMLSFIVFIFGDNLYGRWKESESDPKPIETPLARAFPNVPPTLHEGKEDPTDPAPKDELTVQPKRNEPSSTPIEIEAPLTFPRHGSITSQRSQSQQVEPELSFLLRNWRNPDESCIRARRFGLSGNVLEVHDANRNLVYSGSITRIEGSEVWMADGSRFILTGEQLHHVTTQSTDIFLLC